MLPTKFNSMVTIMAFDINKLNPDLKAKLPQLITLCRERGIEIRPYCGLRDPFEQAKLWRQSRSADEIHEKLNELDLNGAPFLADCIRRVGPQSGRPVTNTPPGLSWHQWGEAVDCFWLVNGKAEWSDTKLINGHNGYKVFADEAEAIGLTAIRANLSP